MLKRKRPTYVIPPGLPQKYALEWGKEGTFTMYTREGWDEFYKTAAGKRRLADNASKNEAIVADKDRKLLYAQEVSNRAINRGKLISDMNAAVDNATKNSSRTAAERAEAKQRRKLGKGMRIR